LTHADTPWVRARGAGVRITVRVVPRASKSAVDGVQNGALRVRLAAPPVDGAGNEALIRVIASALRVRPSAVRIASGLQSRTKTVDVDGVSTHDAMRIR
jgi:uncharacterized protein (TIGR00251 family)